jgi:hypothetical protein
MMLVSHGLLRALLMPWSILIPVGDAPTVKVVLRDLDVNPITNQYEDLMYAHLAGTLAQDDVTAFDGHSVMPAFYLGHNALRREGGIVSHHTGSRRALYWIAK